jgi:hypothetical protein
MPPSGGIGGTAPQSNAGQANRELTFGEKAVGLTFNPSADPRVQAVKAAYATLIDQLNDARSVATSPDVARMYSVAITDLQSAQMWAVKAITWQY